MKKILLIILSFLLLFFVSCNNKKTEKSTNQKTTEEVTANKTLTFFNEPDYEYDTSNVFEEIKSKYFSMPIDVGFNDILNLKSNSEEYDIAKVSPKEVEETFNIKIFDLCMKRHHSNVVVFYHYHFIYHNNEYFLLDSGLWLFDSDFGAYNYAISGNKNEFVLFALIQNASNTFQEFKVIKYNSYEKKIYTNNDLNKDITRDRDRCGYNVEFPLFYIDNDKIKLGLSKEKQSTYDIFLEIDKIEHDYNINKEVNPNEIIGFDLYDDLDQVFIDEFFTDLLDGYKLYSKSKKYEGEDVQKFGNFLYREIEGGVEITGYVDGPGDTPDNIPYLVFNKRVISIGECALAELNLKTVNIPRYVTNIGDYAFAGNNLKEVKLPNELEKIGVGAFFSNPLTSITIPETVTEIGQFAFAKCVLGSVVLPKNINIIDDFCFSSRITNITNINIENITKIGKFAFALVFSRDSKIFENLKTIDAYAFYHCTLDKFYITKNIERIDKTAFYDATINQFIISDDVDKFKLDENGNLVDAITNDILCYINTDN